MAAMSPDRAATSDATPSADDLIRAVMVDQKRDVNRNALPDLEPTEANTQPRQTTTRHAAHPTAQSAPRASWRTRITGYRPRVKHILWAALALIVILRPWLIPGLIFVSFWVVLIAYLTLGHDRIVELVSAGWDRLVRRHPKTAERLRQRADRFALTFDALLDRLPDSWAEKLALPDLSQPGAPGESLDDRPDPFERLRQPEVYRG